MSEPEQSPQWADISNDYVIRVTYRDTDQMGLVYYANYLVWFEIGRTELLRQTGRSYRDFEEKGFFLPVAQCHCDYKSPARYDDLVRIHTRIARMTKVTIVFHYDIYRDSTGELLAGGETKHAFLDQNGKMVRASHILEEWFRREG